MTSSPELHTLWIKVEVAGKQPHLVMGVESLMEEEEALTGVESQMKVEPLVESQVEVGSQTNHMNTHPLQHQARA